MGTAAAPAHPARPALNNFLHGPPGDSPKIAAARAPAIARSIGSRPRDTTARPFRRSCAVAFLPATARLRLPGPLLDYSAPALNTNAPRVQIQSKFSNAQLRGRLPRHPFRRPVRVARTSSLVGGDFGRSTPRTGIHHATRTPTAGRATESREPRRLPSVEGSMRIPPPGRVSWTTRTRPAQPTTPSALPAATHCAPCRPLAAPNVAARSIPPTRGR